MACYLTCMCAIYLGGFSCFLQSLSDVAGDILVVRRLSKLLALVEISNAAHVEIKIV